MASPVDKVKDLLFMDSMLQGKMVFYKEKKMLTHPMTGPVLSVIAGILILIYPRILNYVVGIYFILVGSIALLK
jgi:hypothetical protein